MAIKWSWAWGSETALVLETSAGWDFSSTSASNAAPSASGGADPAFTYPLSPTRYSLNLKSSTYARSPLGIGAPQGWLAGHIYVNNAAGWANNYQVFIVYATSNNKAIRADTISGGTMKFYVENVFKEQTTTVFPPQTWHHIAIKYDMSGGTWEGQLYVNGVAETSLWTEGADAQTSTYFQIAGGINSTLANGTFWSGLVHYDNVGDPGSTSRFVTRISPDQDVNHTGGKWNPNVNQYANLSSPLNTATTVDNLSPIPTDYVTTGVSNLSTQLGLSPNIYAITTHGYSVGTGSSVEAGLGSSAGVTYTYGSSVVTGTATYCTVTSETNPNTAAAWVAAEVPWLRFEIA